jgi:hypothetical protein
MMNFVVAQDPCNAMVALFKQQNKSIPTKIYQARRTTLILNCSIYLKIPTAAVNCGESVCTIGICYVANKIILPSKFNVKLQEEKKKLGGGGGPEI